MGTARRVRSRFRRFAAVSVIVTVLDVAVLAMARVAGAPVLLAAILAVVVASAASWLLHRSLSFADDPFVRWVRQPGVFVWTALGAGAVDVLWTVLLAAVWPLAVAKGLALLASGTVRFVTYRVLLLTDTRRDLLVRHDRPDAPGAHRLTVVLPAYQEASRIGASVVAVREALADVAPEIVVVDDGSTDGTAAAAAAAGARVVQLEGNRGKGAAVRAGMLAASGRTVAFTDADLAYPPDLLRDLLVAVEDGWDVAVGSRWHRDSRALARPSLLRRVSSRLFNLLTATVLLGQYRDTQCGCKAFRSDVARLLFGHTRLDGFAFDVEVLHLVERYRLSLTEVPVQVTDGGSSTVRVASAALRMIRDLFRIRRWGSEGAYERAD
jgi:dolichyl-phosphate beta-glucosyltransferase